MQKKTSAGRKPRAAGSPQRLARTMPPPGPSLRALEIFVAVAQSGSMVAAAKQMKLTQPAISQFIGGLEMNLGVQLFDRSVRPPALTLQGTALIQHARAITDAARQLQSAVRLGSGAPLPNLRIAMLNSFATTIGPHVIKRLQDVAGEWSIDSGFHATRYRTVADREFDFAITADESPVPDEVKAMPILTEPFLIIVPAGYRVKARSLKTLSGDLPLVRFGRDPKLHARIDRMLEKNGVIPQHRYHLDTTEAVIAMIAVGSGWTILPPLACYKSLARGDPIRAWPFPDQAFRRTINVASLKNEGEEIAAQIRNAAIDALKENFVPHVRALLPDCARLISVRPVVT
jgi:DNA-binding transcriptional LysR family regulator